MDDKSQLCANMTFGARSFFHKYKLPLISAFVFLLGLLLGAFAVSLSSEGDFFGILPLVKSSILSRKSSPFHIIFLTSLSVSLSYLLLIFLSALSAFGWLFCPIILLIRGFSTGLISGSLYSGYSLSGVGFYALILLIPYFILSYTLVFAASDGISLSFRIFSAVFTQSPQQIRLNRFYACRYLIYFAFCIVSSLVDAVLSACFINFFSF